MRIINSLRIRRHNAEQCPTPVRNLFKKTADFLLPKSPFLQPCLVDVPSVRTTMRQDASKLSKAWKLRDNLTKLLHAPMLEHDEGYPPHLRPYNPASSSPSGPTLQQQIELLKQIIRDCDNGQEARKYEEIQQQFIEDGYLRRRPDGRLEYPSGSLWPSTEESIGQLRGISQRQLNELQKPYNYR